MRVEIIGAGPAGLWAARLLAKQGRECTVHEEHKKIGEPVHCTGLVSKRLDSIIKLPDEIILNKVKGARLFSKNQQVEIMRGRKEAYVINRKKFDNHLAQLAEKEGAKILLNKKVDAFSLKGDVIAADGAYSITRQKLSIPMKTLPAVQYIVKGKFDTDFVELHFLNPEFFVWVVPEDETVARIGTACRNCMDVLDGFIGKNYTKNKILEKQAGLVVVNGPLKRTVFRKSPGSIILVGDAAGQVKATTGGGIITGMLCAEEAAKHIDSPERYERAWRLKVEKELRVAKYARDFLSGLRIEDYDELLSFVNKNMDAIKKYGDMDFHSRVILEIGKKPGNWLTILKLLLRGIF